MDNVIPGIPEDQVQPAPEQTPVMPGGDMSATVIPPDGGSGVVGELSEEKYMNLVGSIVGASDEGTPFDVDDDTRVLRLQAVSQASSADIDLVSAFGEDVVNGMLVDRGPEALADLAAEWDWAISPSRRASIVADTMFKNTMTGIVTDFVKTAVKPPVDPVARASEIFMERKLRNRSF